MFRPIGTTARARKTGTTSTNGARKCTTLSAVCGTKSSLVMALSAVGDRLEEAIRADPVRAIAVLNAPEPLALQDGGDREESGEGDDDRRDGKKG